MAKVTNTAEGPRGVIVGKGETRETVWLEPNETADLDLHPDHDLYEGVEKGEGPKKAPKAEVEKDESAK